MSDDHSLSKLSSSVESLAESVKYLVKDHEEIKNTLKVVSEAMIEQKLQKTTFEGFQERDAESKKRIYARLESQELELKESRKEVRVLQSEINQSCDIKTQQFNSDLVKVKDDISDDVEAKNTSTVNQMRWAIGIIIAVLWVFSSNSSDIMSKYQDENIKRFEKINTKMENINDTMLKYIITSKGLSHDK